MLHQLYADRTAGHVFSYELSSDALREWNAFVDALEAFCTANPTLLVWLERWPDMVRKLALLLHLGRGLREMDIQVETMRMAIATLLNAGAGGVTRVHQVSQGSQPRAHDFDKVALTLTGKLLRKGAMTRRQLARTYHSQSIEVLGPVIEAAKSKGLVAEVNGTVEAR